MRTGSKEKPKNRPVSRPSGKLNRGDGTPSSAGEGDPHAPTHGHHSLALLASPEGERPLDSSPGRDVWDGAVFIEHTQLARWSPSLPVFP